MIRFVRSNLAFLALALAVVTYVGACTIWRDEATGADAWEHHRAIKALVEDLGHPGNPTLAIPVPSIRYSPYTVAQALICRATGWSAYDVLGGAAVVNTVLLVAGVWCLLRAFGEADAAASVLLVMVGLYAGPPGYANSYALADLPWQQVNPSAFAFALALLAWVLFLRAGKTILGAVAVGVMVGVAMIDHAMTGLFALIGLALFAATVPSFRGVRAFVSVGLIAAIAGAICLAWPWYSFLEAARNKADNAYWYNGYILAMMLTQWAWPAYLCAFASLSIDRPAARISLIGALICFGISAADFALRSPTLARLPMPSMIFLHLPIGIYCHEVGLFRLRTWPGRIRSLSRAEGPEQLRAILASTVALIYLGYLLPQVGQILGAPYLARPYLAKLLHKPPKTQGYRPLLDQVLAKIGSRDVVLADIDTSWMIPSSRGRVVAALHYEFFARDGAGRIDDLAAFFAGSTADARRLEILQKYDVRWILLNARLLSASQVDALTEAQAVIDRVGPLTLLDAKAWADRVRSKIRPQSVPAGREPDPVTP